MAEPGVLPLRFSLATSFPDSRILIQLSDENITFKVYHSKFHLLECSFYTVCLFEPFSITLSTGPAEQFEIKWKQAFDWECTQSYNLLEMILTLCGAYSAILIGMGLM